METRIQRPVLSVTDENAHVVGLGKMNANKNGKEVKRAVLGDIASNRLTTLGFNSHSNLPKSKLPVLKTGYAKPKTSTIVKPKPASSKENQVSEVNAKPPPVKKIIEKTRKLKLDEQHCLDQQRRLKELQRPTGVEDIDKDDEKNPFLLSCYVLEIYKYLNALENSHPIRENYLKGNTEITPKMRAIVIDWLVEVQQEYRLSQETLHLAVGILDTYLQTNPKVDKNKMQLIGITALFLATKYEEITVPAVEELVYISASAFKERDLYQMEIEMFRAINFDLSRPISLTFLRRFSKAAHANSEQHTFGKYFIELALIEYQLCHIKPSVVAAAALYLALFITSDLLEIDESLWTPCLEYYSNISMSCDIKPILGILAKLVYSAKSSKLQSVVQKYSSSKFFRVSARAELYSDRMKKLASQ